MPDDRPESALARISRGLSRLLGWLVLPLAWLADVLAWIRTWRKRAAYFFRRNYLWIVLPLGIGLYAVFAWVVGLELFWTADGILSRLSDQARPDSADIRTDSADIRNLAYAVAALLGALAIAATVPFQLIKTWMNERQTDATEQGLVTDRFTKAVGQLGEEKTVKREETVERTEPNLEVRLGAIYALERIAQDSERDHIPVMEVLCAYVRENARGHKQTLEKPHERPRADVKAVLDVLVRRFKRHPEREAHEETEGYWLDLTYTDLAHRDLDGLTLPRADLSHAYLEGAKLKGAWLREATLKRARLGDAKLDGAKLGYAKLQGAQLGGANLEGADLSVANLEGANLEGAELWSADLKGADLVGANLRSADLKGWEIARANLRSADLREAKNLSQQSVDTAFGDTTTQLPDGIAMPEDWKTRAPLAVAWDPDPEYDAWLRAQQAKAGKPAGDGA